MNTVAQEKLSRLMHDLGGRAVATKTGLSEKALRSLRDGKATPREKTRAAFLSLLISDGDWKTPANQTPAEINPIANAEIPHEANADELAAALAEAQTIYRSKDVSLTDRVKALNVSCTALVALSRNRQPSHIAEYADFEILAHQLEEALEPYPAIREAVDLIFQEFDARVSLPTEDPGAALHEVAAIADELLRTNPTMRDRTTVLAVKVRAAKELKKVSDDPKDAVDYQELKARIIAALKTNADALTLVANHPAFSQA